MGALGELVPLLGTPGTPDDAEEQFAVAGPQAERLCSPKGPAKDGLVIDHHRRRGWRARHWRGLRRAGGPLLLALLAPRPLLWRLLR